MTARICHFDYVSASHLVCVCMCEVLLLVELIKFLIAGNPRPPSEKEVNNLISKERCTNSEMRNFTCMRLSGSIQVFDLFPTCCECFLVFGEVYTKKIESADNYDGSSSGWVVGVLFWISMCIRSLLGLNELPSKTKWICIFFFSPRVKENYD